MPAVSKSQARLFGMAHALQTGKLSPSKVSPSVRDLAQHISPTDALHFAETKHQGLPEKVASRNGFLAMVRKVQAGEHGLESASKSVSDVAKRFEPKDKRAEAIVDGMTSQAALTKMSSVWLLASSQFLQKQADVHSILARTHKAMHQAGAKNRELLRSELDQLKSVNQKLQGQADQASSKIMQAETKAQAAAQKQQQAETEAAMASKSIEQLQMAQMAQRTPPPPEQPAYGHMLLGGQPGGAPAAPAPAQMPGQ